MGLTPGSWTELISGLFTAAVAGVLGVMAWRQGQRAVAANERANRLAEAALDVRFEARYWPSEPPLLQLTCEGAAVWVHNVWSAGGASLSRTGNGGLSVETFGKKGEMTVLGMGEGPWRMHREAALTMSCDWDIDVKKANVGTLTVGYSTTADGDVASFIVQIRFPGPDWDAVIGQ